MQAIIICKPISIRTHKTQTDLYREFASDWFVVADIVTGMAAIRRLFGGQRNVLVAIRWHFIQHAIRPSWSTSISETTITLTSLVS